MEAVKIFPYNRQVRSPDVAALNICVGFSPIRGDLIYLLNKTLSTTLSSWRTIKIDRDQIIAMTTAFNTA